MTPDRRQKFLDRLAAGHTVKAAAKAAGLTRQRFYQLRDEDEQLAQDWAAAEREGVDALEEEALRRAVKGVKSVEPIYFMGAEVGSKTVTKYSDGLLTMLLKARDRAKFGDKSSVDVSVDGGTPQLSDERRAERIAALIASVKERAAETEPDGEASE